MLDREVINQVVIEAEKIYFACNCTVKEAIEKAKEVMLNETKRNDRTS